MPLTPGQRRLYGGGYNYMSQAWQPDGTVAIVLTGGRLPIGHLMHVAGLWGEHEEVLTEIVIPPGPPSWIQQRLEEAGRGPH